MMFLQLWPSSSRAVSKRSRRRTKLNREDEERRRSQEVNQPWSVFLATTCICSDRDLSSPLNRGVVSLCLKHGEEVSPQCCVLDCLDVAGKTLNGVLQAHGACWRATAFSDAAFRRHGRLQAKRSFSSCRVPAKPSTGRRN